MIITLTIFLVTVVTNSQGKYIELLSNEEFQDILTRRADTGDDSNEDNKSKQISSEESFIDIGNRDDKSYIPDVDLALADINRRIYTGLRRENLANNANLNEVTFPLYKESVTIGDKNTKEGQRVNQEKNTPDYETPEQSKTEYKIIKNTTGVSTILKKSTEILLKNEKKSNNKSILSIDVQAPEHDLMIHIPKNDSTVYNSESSSKVRQSYKHDSSDSTLTDEIRIDLVIDSTTNKSAVVLTTLDSQVFTTTTQNPDEDNTATTENYSAVTENSSINEHLKTIIETTTFLPALTQTIEEEQSTKKTKQITNTVISTVNEIEYKNKSEQCINCYRAHEIISPIRRGNQEFLKNQVSLIDQSNFAHAYKSPNFAYYNQKYRLGLNEVKDKSIGLGTHESDTVKAKDLLSSLHNDLKKLTVLKDINKRLKTSDDLSVKGSTGTHETKSGVKKDLRVFDNTNIDLIPELMFAKLGKAYTYKNLVDMKQTRISHLFDFVKLRNVSANSNKVKNNYKKTIKKRSNDESEISIYMNVIKDLILEDSKALKQYDWLATTVQIQSALTKILELINRMRQSEPIHPADLQILKYIVFLHNFSLGVKEDNKLNNKWKMRANLLPRNKKKRKNKLLTEKGLINRVWLLRTLLPDSVEEDEFSQMYEFVYKVQDGLFHLHEAIRLIAEVTKFDRQNWYGNLKQLYLSADEKHLQEILLHISVSRLIYLVEHSCKQGLDRDFTHFLETHEKNAKRIVEEMLFIDKIVDEIKINME